MGIGGNLDYFKLTKTMYQHFIGIDPGVSGAIASISPSGITLIDCPFTETKTKVKARKKEDISTIQGLEIVEKPKTRTKTTTKSNPALMASELSKLITPNSIIVIENVHSMPDQGVASTFSFGVNYGIWQGIIAALNVPIEFVTPQSWKKHFGLIGTHKDASREKALQLFPEQAYNLRFKYHHGRADALLLAEYLRRRLAVNVA